LYSSAQGRGIKITGAAVLRLAACLFGLLALVPVAAWARLQVDDGFLRSARVGDVSVLPRDQLRARLEAHANTWRSAPFTIHAGPYVSRRTRAALGASLDVDRAHDQASALGRSGHPIADLSLYFAGSRDRLQLRWVPRIERTRLASALVEVQAQVERPPVPGSYGRDGRLMPGLPGQTVNSVNAIERLEQALRSGADSARLAVVAIAPPSPLSYAAVHANGASQLLYAGETLYPGGRAGRSRNIEVSVEAIDGAVIEPDGEFSFNRQVGERSYERGFVAAKELANRRVVDGVGGGVCQVAATVHAAAFLAGMDITTYRPHSRPVSYIPLGLDTMVSWPDRDLKIRNPYPFPVTIRARATEGLVHVELLGGGRPNPVEWSTRVLERIPAGEQRIFDRALRLRPSEQRVLQEPIDGLLVERSRTIYWPSGPETTSVKLRYPPTPRIVARGAADRGAGVATRFRPR
jgi:vancomycin resistance protein YoaR